MQPVIIDIIADPRATVPASIDHFAGTLLLLRITPSATHPIAGSDVLNIELHPSASDTSTTALALTSLSLPLGSGPYDLLLTSAQLNQPLAGRSAADYWLVAYTTTGDAIQIQYTAVLRLAAHAASLLAPAPPAPAVALSRAQADLLYATLASYTTLAARVTTLENVPPSSSAVTSVAGRTGAVVLSQSDIGGTALRSIVTSAPGLLSAAGGTFGSGAFHPVFDGSAPGSLGGVDPGDGVFVHLTAEEAHFPYLEAQATNYPLGATFTYGGTVAATHRAALSLDLVSNTADASKPVSTAQQAALNLKANLASPTFTGTVSGTFSGPLTGNVTGNVSGTAANFTGLLSGDVTGTQLASVLASTGVTAASYTAANITVDSKGRITAASNGTGSSVDLSSPGPIGATTPSTIRATNFTSTTGVNSFGNTNFQDSSVFNLLGTSKANLQSALTLGAFDDVVHKGITLTGVLTITSSGSTPVFTYAAGAAAIHRTALGLGTLATITPTGDATTYLRGDGAWTAVAVTSVTSSQISDSTSFGRALLTAASVAAQRLALNVELFSSSGTNRTSVGGNNAITGGTTNCAIGKDNTIANTNSFCLGESHYISAYVNFITGRSAKGDLPGMRAHSSGPFVNTGDNQLSEFQLSAISTGVTPIELALRTVFSATDRLTVGSGIYRSGILMVQGINSTGSTTAFYLRQICIKNQAGTTSLIANTTIGSDVSGGTVLSVTADVTNNRLAVFVTGLTAETWRWTGWFSSLQTYYA